MICIVTIFIQFSTSLLILASGKVFSLSMPRTGLNRYSQRYITRPPIALIRTLPPRIMVRTARTRTSQSDQHGRLIFSRHRTTFCTSEGGGSGGTFVLEDTPFILLYCSVLFFFACFVNFSLMKQGGLIPTVLRHTTL